jgi:hypothetical protein
VIAAVPLEASTDREATERPTGSKKHVAPR